jgi:hypothetical protein
MGLYSAGQALRSQGNNMWTNPGSTMNETTTMNQNGDQSILNQANLAAQAGLTSAQASAVHDPYNLGMNQLGFQQSKFNQILPLLSGQLGDFNSQFATAGGSNGTPPPISTGPVLNPQQIQQQVNTSRAANDTSMAGQQQTMQNSVAGRGFGANSPLAMSLGQGLQNQNLATNTANESATRLNAAQMNAQHLLGSQQALSNQWQQGNALDIERRKPIFARQNALIAALASIS